MIGHQAVRVNIQLMKSRISLPQGQITATIGIFKERRRSIGTPLHYVIGITDKIMSRSSWHRHRIEKSGRLEMA